MSDFYRLLSTETETTLELRGRRFVLGRGGECDLCVDAADVSRRHLILEISKGVLYVEDAGSSNGTFINGQRCRSRHVLKPRDVLGVGSNNFTVSGPGDCENLTVVNLPAESREKSFVSSEAEGNATQLVGLYPLPSDWPAEKESRVTQAELKSLARDFERSIVAGRLYETDSPGAFWLRKTDKEGGQLLTLKSSPGNEWTLGRKQDCDLVLSDPSVSLLHAHISLRGGEWTILDAASTNGISINGVMSKGPSTIVSGDLLAIGAMDLMFRSLVRQ